MLNTVRYLVILGFVIICHDRQCTADYRCELLVETVDVAVPLSPSSDYCGRSSVTVPDVVRGYCSNNGNNCLNHHHRHTETLLRRFCIPSATATVTGTVTVTSSGCSKTVTYRYANATDCECEYIGTATVVTM